MIDNCDGLFLLWNSARHLKTVPDVIDLESHYEDCEECAGDPVTDLFDKFPRTVRAAYMRLYGQTDADFEEFSERYQGHGYSSLGHFWEEYLEDTENEKLNQFYELAQELAIRVHIPEDFDAVAVEQDFDYDNESGAVFFAGRV